MEKISNFRVEHMFLPNDDIINLEKGLGDTSLKSAQNLRVIRVLIEGAPGVGKTTICRKSCKDWASGSLWPEYMLVVYVPLRNDAIVEATELWQLLDHDSEAFRREVAEEVKRTGGDGLLLLLDGWDEIDPSKIKKTSILRKLLRREILRSSHLDHMHLHLLFESKPLIVISVSLAFRQSKSNSVLSTTSLTNRKLATRFWRSLKREKT